MAELKTLLDAVHLATRKLSSLGDMEVVLRDVLQICVDAVGASGGTIYLHEPANRTLRFQHVLPAEVASRLEHQAVPDDYGVVGRVFQTAQPEISEYGNEGDPERKRIAERSGLTVRNMLTVPLQIADMPPIGVVQLVNKRGGNFDSTDIDVLDTVSDVSTLAVLNSRLLDQSTRVASLEGMGRAAHDLANKAASVMAMLPHFEHALDGLRKSVHEGGSPSDACFHLDTLEDIYRTVFVPSSDRVYRYARLINDLAAGKKLTPQVRPHRFNRVVQEAVQYLEPRARQSHVGIRYDLQSGMPDAHIDDLFLIRIVENLVGNAVKASAEVIPDSWFVSSGFEEDSVYNTVTVRTRLEDAKFILEVSDQGPGMSPETRQRVLSGEARSRWGRSQGTGLGLKAVRELVASLGGTLEIDSEIGVGTTFRVAL